MRERAGIVVLVKLAVIAAILVASMSSHALADDIVLGAPSREVLRPPGTVEVGPPIRPTTSIPQPPVAPPAPPAETGSVGALGGLVGGVAVIYVVAKFWRPRMKTGYQNNGSGWRSGRTPRRSTGYAALVPDVRNIREVSFVPTATPESVHTGISLRW